MSKKKSAAKPEKKPRAQTVYSRLTRDQIDDIGRGVIAHGPDPQTVCRSMGLDDKILTTMLYRAQAKKQRCKKNPQDLYAYDILRAASAQRQVNLLKQMQSGDPSAQAQLEMVFGYSRNAKEGAEREIEAILAVVERHVDERTWVTIMTDLIDYREKTATLARNTRAKLKQLSSVTEDDIYFNAHEDEADDEEDVKTLQ